MSSVTYPVRNNKVIAENRRVWMGIDVHKKNADLTIVDTEQVVFQRNIPMDEEHFAAILRRLPGCAVTAVYEAGPTGYRVLRWLDRQGAYAFMTPPSMVPTRHGDYVKNDRRDGLKLAVTARGGMLVEMWDLTDEQYEHRELVRTRRQLVEHRTAICQQIRSKLLFHGHSVPQKYSGWSNALLEWLESAPTGRPSIDVSLRSLTRMYRDLSREIRALELELAELAKSDTFRESLELLKSIPGVGPITAMTFLTEIGSLERFRTAENFTGFLGLAPSETSSGERRRKGGLPRKGNAHIRGVLVQAAWVLISKDKRMREVYERIRSRHATFGPQKAIIGVARRLALAMRAVLRDGTLYEYEGCVSEKTEEQGNETSQ